MRRRRKYAINQPVEPLMLFPAVAVGTNMEQMSDSVAEALGGAGEGAEWLHLVAAKGAWQSDELSQLVGALTERGVAVQLEGAGHEPDRIARVLDWGVKRVVLPPDAVEQPALLQETVARHEPERILGTIVAGESDLSPAEVAEQLKGLGVERALYRETDAAIGPNLAAVGALTQQSGLLLVVDGAIRSLEQLKQVRWLQPFGVEGVVLREAVDKRRFTLAEARAALREQLPSDARAR